MRKVRILIRPFFFSPLTNSKSFDISKYTNFTNEIVYSPANDQLASLFEIVNRFVPFLSISSVMNSTALLPRLSSANSYVGVEFPDFYSVSILLPN
jgi:hypothetical protein